MSCGYVFTDSNNRKIVFSGDTKPCDNLAEYGENADLLVHECTFHDEAEVLFIYEKIFDNRFLID